jgi:hypothetical protein
MLSSIKTKQRDRTSTQELILGTLVSNNKIMRYPTIHIG